MQSEPQSYIPINPKELELYVQRANALLNSVKHTPGAKARAMLQGGSAPTGPERELSASPAPAEETQKILDIARALSGDAFLLSDVSNHVMTTLRDGVCIGSHMVAQFGKAAGLETLALSNRAGRLTEGQKTEFQNKTTTAAAIGVFTLASYVVWKLTGYEEAKVSEVKMCTVELPELPLATSTKAIDCVLFYLGLHLAKSGVVQTDIQMVKATICYFQAVIDHIKFQEKSLGYVELFAAIKYRLVDTKFTVDGFQLPAASIIVVNEFNRLPFSAIAGNRVAKHEARRLAERLVCYDPVARMNPFNVIGGFQDTGMGFGFPGGGKSMQIAAEATLIEELCKAIGLKFIFHQLPGALVSAFQGTSEEKMEAWMRIRSDTEHIIYMPIDDAEDKLENRTNQGVSEGVKGIISSYLRQTEGASAPKQGNSVIRIFTNLPEKIDPAVNSRNKVKFAIDGPVTAVDFMYADYLWWKKIDDVDPTFIGMKLPKDDSWRRSQDDVSSLSALLPKEAEVTDERIKDALSVADKAYGRDEHMFFGLLFAEVKKRYPMFTGRDERNMQTAVSSRLNDFDLPNEWFDKPEIFFRQQFDRKVDMLKELMKGNMKGLTFAEIRYQEAMRYLGTLAQIANVDRERRIKALVETMEIEHEARKRFTAEK